MIAQHYSQLAEMYITTPAQAQERLVQQATMQIQSTHLRQLLDRRMAAARDRGDLRLLQQLEAEHRYIVY
jgi:hypothetical protein